MQSSISPALSRTPEAGDASQALGTSLAFNQEQLFRTLFQSAPIGVIMTEAHNGRVVLVNDRMVRTLGYTREQMMQMTSRDFTHPEDRAANEDLYRRLLHGESGECVFQKRYLRQDGEAVWARATMIPLRLSADSPLYVLAAVEDVTASRRAEQLLRESEQRFRIVTEASPIMVWMAGTDKLCYYFNPGWLDFVGRTLEQEAGNGWAENVHPDDFDRCLKIYVENFDARRAFEMHYRLKHRSGQYRWILDHGVPRYDADGNFEGFIGGCLDIHDQIEATEKLQLAEKLAATGRLAATVAHEINNPLASVTNLLYLVGRDPDLSESSRQKLHLAEQELDRVAYFAKQTLGLYRESSGAAMLDAAELIQDVLKTYGPRLQNRSVVLQLEIQEGAKVFAAANEFRQVLSNLLINAIDALPADGGRVRIRAVSARSWKSDHTGLRLIVADTGCGIEKSAMDKIFEPFFTTKREVGTGLGLWLSKNIVEKNHGQLRVRSRTSGPQCGTVFSIFWADGPR